MKVSHPPRWVALLCGAAVVSACTSSSSGSAAPSTTTDVQTTDLSAAADVLSDTTSTNDTVASDAVADSKGPAPTNACEAFTPCGGALEGKWTITGYCSTAAAAGPDFSKFPACADSGLTATTTVSGDATFSAGYLSWKWEAITTHHFAVSEACVTAAGGGATTTTKLCDQRKQVAGTDATCAVTGGTCVCDWTTKDSQPYYNGKYTVSGNDLVYDTSLVHDPYCVAGDTLRYNNSYRGIQFVLTRDTGNPGADAGSTPDAGATPDVVAPIDVVETPDVVTVDASTPTLNCDGLKSKCPNDPGISAEALAACKTGLASAKCHDITIAGFGCLISKEICTAGGKHDDPGTMALCKTEIAALQACLANP